MINGSGLEKGTEKKKKTLERRTEPVKSFRTEGNGIKSEPIPKGRSP